MSPTTLAIVEQIGWMLLHSIWLLVIPAALFGCFLWLTPQSYSRLRYVAGIAVLAIMTCLPIVATTLIDVSGKSVAATDVEKSDLQNSSDRTVDQSRQAESVELDPTLDDGMPGDAERRSIPIPTADVSEPAVVVGQSVPEAGEPSDPLAGEMQLASSENADGTHWFGQLGELDFVRPFLPWAVAGWTVGVLLMSLRLLMGWRSTRRLKRRGVQPVPEAVENLFAELKQRIGGCQAARLVESTLVSVPSIVGHFRPLVLVPVSALTGLSEEQLRAILAHELAHVKRHDYLVNVCQTVVETLLFYHPAVWWVSRCVREERENCCDDLALRYGCRASELAKALVTVDAIRPAKGQELVDSALIPAADGGSLLRRVRRLAGANADKHVAGRSWVAGGIALGLTATMLLASIASIDSVAQETGPSAFVDNRPDSNAIDFDAVAAKEIESAPENVPWPDEKWTTSLPPSGSGIRVNLDERRWVEFNSVYATRNVDDQRTQVHWKADGELINPPPDLDPTSLVPDRDGGEMPNVTRGFLMQVVGPKDTQVALNTSGVGGYGNRAYPLGDSFVQIPLDTIASSIGYNHAYVEVKVSREVKELFSLDDPRIQVLIDNDANRVFIATPDARDYAWQLMVNQDGETIGLTPTQVGGVAERNLPESLKPILKDQFKQSQLLGWSFDKDQPLPELVSLEQTPYDVVRFDNLSVYPGPRTAVVAALNGVPIEEEHRPKISNKAGNHLEASLSDSADDEEFETVTLTGSVVDKNGVGISDCWVGLFIRPQESDGQSSRSPGWAKQPLSAFGDGPPLTLETQTNALGQFTLEAPKTHFVFDGQFWAMRPDGTLGMKRLNAVWPHVQNPEVLKIRITDEQATVRVMNPDGEPVANADVTLEAIRMPRSVTHRLPEAVQRRIQKKTDDAGRVTFGGMETAGVRGVAVSADDYGTQFLSDRLASAWIRGDEPLTLQLQQTASLSGRIIDYDPQLDEGLKLLARTEQPDDRPPMYGRAIMDVKDDGTFQIDRLVAGRLTLESSLLPESRRKIRFEYIPSLEAGESRVLEGDQNPRAVPAVLVRQRLIKADTGEGIPNSRLSVLWGDRGDGGRFQQSQALITDAAGWWTAHVLPGTIDVRLVSIPDGYRSTKWFDGRNRRGSLTVPATDKLVTLPPERYVPAVKIKGQLQFIDGSPAADWSVNGHPVSWDDVGLGAVQTNRDGSFTLSYPSGYPPRFFSTSNRQWMTEHDFTDNYVVPEVITRDPLVLQIPETKSNEDASSDK